MPAQNGNAESSKHIAQANYELATIHSSEPELPASQSVENTPAGVTLKTEITHIAIEQRTEVQLIAAVSTPSPPKPRKKVKSAYEWYVLWSYITFRDGCCIPKTNTRRALVLLLLSVVLSGIKLSFRFYMFRICYLHRRLHR